MARSITPDSLKDIDEDSGESMSDVAPIPKKYQHSPAKDSRATPNKKQVKMPDHYRANKEYDPDQAAVAYWKNNMKTKEYLEWELRELDKQKHLKQSALRDINKVMKTPKKTPKNV